MSIADPEKASDHRVSFERILGDASGTGPFAWVSAVQRDEHEAYPDEALRALHEIGVPRRYVPSELGGEFISFEHLLGLARTLARRDPSLALSTGFAIWSQLAWMAGNEAQRIRVRDAVLRGDGCCLAASEPTHGADLLASEVTAVRANGGFLLRGKKWPIGLASRAKLALVLARTNEEAGPRSLSWLMLERESMQRVTRLKPVRTLGLRASDLAGLAFPDVPVPADALLGPDGGGLELTLRLFQITRPLVGGLALGIADSALRIATAFAIGRRLYRTTVAALPVIEDLLVGAYTDLLAAEVVARSVVRGLHTAPEEMSAASDIAKIVVPELTGRALAACAQVLGAQFFLREGMAGGIFQQLLRDHLALALFDGSSLVCLQALALQLPSLLRDPLPKPAAGDSARFAFDGPLPPFQPQRLDLTSHGQDAVLQSLAERDLPPDAAALRGEILAQRRQLGEAFAAFRAARSPQGSRSPALFRLARRYAQLHAASAALQARRQSGALEPSWATVCALRVLDPEAPLRERAPPSVFEHLRDLLYQSVLQPRALSLSQDQLPDSPLAQLAIQDIA